MEHGFQMQTRGEDSEMMKMYKDHGGVGMIMGQFSPNTIMYMHTWVRLINK